MILILECPVPSTKFRFLCLICPLLYRARSQAGRNGTLGAGAVSELASRKNQNDGAPKILTLPG